MDNLISIKNILSFVLVTHDNGGEFLSEDYIIEKLYLTNINESLLSAPSTNMYDHYIKLYKDKWKITTLDKRVELVLKWIYNIQTLDLGVEDSITSFEIFVTKLDNLTNQMASYHEIIKYIISSEYYTKGINNYLLKRKINN